MPARTHRPTRTAIAAALILSLASCGSDDDGGSADPTTATTDAAPSPEGAGASELEVVLRDFEFAGLPDEVDAGTRLTVTNEAPAELHEVVAFRLPDDEERSVEELAQLAPDELMGVLGEPVTVLLAEPGGPTIPAVGDGTLAEPGRYALMCFIPTGVEPAEYLRVAAETESGPPQVDGGPPHLVHGMHAELTVR
jgi:hypothetical protein